MIKLNGLGKFDSDVRKWFKAVEVAAAGAAVGMAKQAFNQVIYTGPQYSGDYISNMRFEIGRVTPSFTAGLVPARFSDVVGDDGVPRLNPYGMGDSPAITYAKRQLTGDFSGFKLGQSVFIHNSANHPNRDERGVTDIYAFDIENGLINLRPVNNGAYHTFARAATFVLNRNKTINTPAHLAALRRIGV